MSPAVLIQDSTQARGMVILGAAEVFGLATIRMTTLAPSSRGLGHRPFTAVTGVRIPVGSSSALGNGQ